MKRTILLVLVLGPALAMVGLVQAAATTVGPGAGYDFETIQAGIDAANDGDTVLVAPGEYVITEPITFRGKAITVRSEAGRDATTIRMGTPTDTNRGSVVVFEDNETPESVLDGFTITGGEGIFLQGVWGGGGILLVASAGTLNNCAIVKNRTRDAGGGVCCAYDSSVTMNNCTVMENSAEGAGGGGGVIVYSGSSATLANCVINGNSANVESGGGICCAYDSSVIMNNCTIIENSTQSKGGGGVMSYNKSLATLTNCLIAGNSTQWGGGVMSERESSSTLTNCIISRNSAEWEGGGVVCYNKSLATITNCTIWGNSAAQSGGGVECLDWSSATVNNSIIWGNTAPKGRELSAQDAASTLTIAYSNVAGGQSRVSVDGGSVLNWGEGNIDAEPYFADQANDDYHLKSEAGRWNPDSQSWVQDAVTSPCIDAGDPNSDWKPELWPHGMRTNMGAYGGTLQAGRSLSDVGNIADLNRDKIVDSADMCMIVDNWHTENTLCDIAPVPLGDGFVDVQDLIVLADHLSEVIPPAELVEVTEADNGAQVELERGKLLVVTLESNPSTGYRWELIENNESILKQFGQPEFRQSENSGPPLIGAGGWEIFRFKAMRAGQMTLQLVYHRPWEEGAEPLKTFSLEVVVP